ncbi:nuclear transport factor 2 family protein [Sporosarcina sp. ACRSL]|uniref:nuclear transport factor 2 family protein n=1 Tax=Sporosarcina sp. ACRSL TaxID=2918215 RepID=UPI001EF41E69|nr:nuclear transport factor 2 family protein [Sporosarcina sp. ACRSL]MCG7344312.1 nuclear transport factor 2 family protein [Sporosarcina sp. ACRSL]
MKKILVFSLLISVLMIGACSKKEDTSSNHGSVNDGEVPSEFGSIDHGVDESKVGFNLAGGTIEEAANVPAEEKESILKSFDTYIDAFNHQDIDEYMSTLSENPKSFDLNEEREYIETVFDQFELTRDAKDITIVKFDEETGEAQVFANLSTKMKQKSTGLETNREGRQVTVFTKEGEDWKVNSVYYMEDQK